MPEAAQPEKLRLFVAVPIPETVKREILAAQSSLKNLVGDAIRWTNPDQLHLTMRFLGRVDSAKTESLKSALQHACSGFSSFELKAEGIGFFPRPAAPRVVWIGVGDVENVLPALHAAVIKATDPFTAEEPENRFTPHVTLGRVRQIRRPEVEALLKAVEKMRNAHFGSWAAKTVELIRSHLSPQGARYSVIGAFPLGASR